jgi:DnaJ domain
MGASVVMIDATPLTWPISQPRTMRRIDARFKTKMVFVVGDLVSELRLLGAKDVVISTNAPVSRNGTPYANSNEPTDPGAAVYFDRRVVDNRPGHHRDKWKSFVIACDTYRKLVWNLRAIGMTVEALRTIQRHGASSMLEQAFTGFAALPPAEYVKPWWEVLGVDENATREEIRDAMRELAKIHHPDAGGSQARMAEINAAFERSQL